MFSFNLQALICRIIRNRPEGNTGELFPPSLPIRERVILATNTSHIINTINVFWWDFVFAGRYEEIYVPSVHPVFGATLEQRLNQSYVSAVLFV